MTEVVALDEFAVWFRALDRKSADAVARYVKLLAENGVSLGHPYSSAIQGSAVALRELRVRHAGAAIRVLYAFDPDRRAVVVLGGDKANDKRFYNRSIPRAERLFAAYLAQRK